MSQIKKETTSHYVHRLSYSARERLVGTFILVALLFLIALIGFNEKTLLFFEPKVTFHSYFQNAKGLSTDTLVTVLGVNVGKVSDVSISEDQQIHATIFVYDRYAYLIRSDSRARLNRLAVIGGARIEISSGSMDKPQLADGSHLQAEETLSLDELLEGLANLVNMGGTESGTNLLADLSETIRDLKHFISKVRSGEGALGTLIYGEKFHGDLTSAVALLEQIMSETSDTLHVAKPAVDNIVSATSDLPELVSSANQAISTLNVGLHQFPDLLVRLNLVLEEATRVLEAMQRVWPISSAVRQADKQQLIEAQPVNE